MKNNFIAYNPVKLHFGDECIQNLGKELKPFGKKIFVVIGKGSVKKAGILDEILEKLKVEGFQTFVFEGIKSNPEFEKVEEGILLLKNFQADSILAIGGGSVIDSAKAMAIGAKSENSIWEIFIRKQEAPTESIPLFCVLTLAATGTEMNMFSVLQSTKDQRKTGFGHVNMYPKASFLNPNYTLSVPKNYTAFGVVDLIAHTLEQYFSTLNWAVSEHFAVSILKNCFEIGPKLLENLGNYEYREQIMWQATVALNGTIAHGKGGGDWGVHAFEHVLSVLYDIPHGAGLSIVYPAWLKQKQSQIESRLDFLEQEMGMKKGTFIQNLEELFVKLDSPIRLSEYKIGAEQHTEIYNCLVKNKVNGTYHQLDEYDYKKMLELMA